jgi:hypothetical protein
VIRKRLGMSQRQFAAAIHVPLATLQNWEQGRTPMDPECARADDDPRSRTPGCPARAPARICGVTLLGKPRVGSAKPATLERSNAIHAIVQP